MAQLFHPSTKVISRASIAFVLIVVAIIVWVSSGMYNSAYFTQENVAREQPVPFSHQHHVSGLGISCRYCHTSVEESASAGIPSTQTCMSCHSQVWTNAALLEPVRKSYQADVPLRWVRVHDLQDFAYFNHSIHVKKGIGCQTCHGQVDEMPLTWKVHSLYMGWCLDCHRAPEKYIRPREEVLNMSYVPPDNQLALGRELVKKYHVNTHQLSDCSICHR